MAETLVKLVGALAKAPKPPDVGAVVVVAVVPKLVFPNAGCANAVLPVGDPNPVCAKAGCPKPV
jgi:hypothetical protein